MSQELSVISPALSFAKGGLTLNVSPQQFFVNVTGAHKYDDNGTATTVDQTLSKGAIGTIGWFAIENLDSTNNLLVGIDGVNYPIVFKPGEGSAWRVNGANVHVKSSAANVPFYYAMVED